MARPQAVFLVCLALAGAQEDESDGDSGLPCPSHAQELLDAVLEGYQRRTSPFMYETWLSGSDAPATYVYATHTIYSLRNVDMRTQTVELQLWMTYQWTDSRLAWDRSCFATDEDVAWFHGDPSGLIWLPSTYVENLVDEEETLMGDWGIYDDGTVSVAKKVTWKLACTMDFSMMPYDSSLCHAKVTTWTELSPYMELDTETCDGCGGFGGRTTSEGGVLEFDILTDGVRSADIGVDDGGYPYLKLYFKLERKPEFRVRTAIEPVLCFVIVVYLSFWLTPAAVPARVAIVMIGVLAISNKISSVQGGLPEFVGSVWLIEFMSTSFYFCFAAILVNVLVNYLNRMEQRVTAAAKAATTDREGAGAEDGGGGMFLPTTLEGQLVLVHAGGRQYRADNSNLQSDDDGLYYYSSPHLHDKTNELCNWGDTVEGAEDETGWVKVSGSGGVPVATASTKLTMRRQTYFYDWVLVGSNGKVLIRDQDVDVLFRVLFPVAYAIALGVLHGRLD